MTECDVRFVEVRWSVFGTRDDDKESSAWRVFIEREGVVDECKSFV